MVGSQAVAEGEKKPDREEDGRGREKRRQSACCDWDPTSETRKMSGPLTGKKKKWGKKRKGLKGEGAHLQVRCTPKNWTRKAKGVVQNQQSVPGKGWDGYEGTAELGPRQIRKRGKEIGGCPEERKETW